MQITILQASMTRDPEEGFRGRVEFQAEGHKQPYEVTLFSKKGSMWDYSLNFSKQSGPEAEIDKIEADLEGDDELFDQLIDEAMKQLS